MAIDIAAADWKDIPSLIENLAAILADHGIRLTDHSDDWGSDDFIVSVTMMSDPVPTLVDIQKEMGMEVDQ
jgi:hypothetical protein